MKIILAGATGFIGRALVERLSDEHDLAVLTRVPEKYADWASRARFVYWDPNRRFGEWVHELDRADVLINLAGEPVMAKRWSRERKKQLLESRVTAVRTLLWAVKQNPKTPSLWINASAVGYYGTHDEEVFDEGSGSGTGFLADTCRMWENELSEAELLGIRLIRLRIGLVLEKDGGVLSKMLPVFRAGLGGVVGSGRQWLSWIHREDLIGLIQFLIQDAGAQGAYNATAPCPVRMKEFAHTLADALKRPSFFWIPPFLPKLWMGEMADMILRGQNVQPKRILEAGFVFQYPILELALKDILE